VSDTLTITGGAGTGFLKLSDDITGTTSVTSPL